MQKFMFSQVSKTSAVPENTSHLENDFFFGSKTSTRRSTFWQADHACREDGAIPSPLPGETEGLLSVLIPLISTVGQLTDDITLCVCLYY